MLWRTFLFIGPLAITKIKAPLFHVLQLDLPSVLRGNNSENYHLFPNP